MLAASGEMGTRDWGGKKNSSGLCNILDSGFYTMCVITNQKITTWNLLHPWLLGDTWLPLMAIKSLIVMESLERIVWEVKRLLPIFWSGHFYIVEQYLSGNSLESMGSKSRAWDKVPVYFMTVEELRGEDGKSEGFILGTQEWSFRRFLESNVISCTLFFSHSAIILFFY